MVAVAAIVGLTLSICTVTVLLGGLWLPAASVTVWAVELPDAVSVWSAGQATSGMPDPPGSVQVNRTVTSLLYQPLALGLVVAAAVIDGAALSILKLLLFGVSRLAAVSPARGVHRVRAVPAYRAACTAVGTSNTQIIEAGRRCSRIEHTPCLSAAGGAGGCRQGVPSIGEGWFGHVFYPRAHRIAALVGCYNSRCRRSGP